MSANLIRILFAIRRQTNTANRTNQCHGAFNISGKVHLNKIHMHKLTHTWRERGEERAFSELCNAIRVLTKLHCFHPHASVYYYMDAMHTTQHLIDRYTCMHAPIWQLQNDQTRIRTNSISFSFRIALALNSFSLFVLFVILSSEIFVAFRVLCCMRHKFKRNL